MTNRKCLFLLSLGIVFTLILPIKMFVSAGWQIAFDIVAMLGSGICCSTFVSWFIEKQNEKRNAEVRKKQREYILATVRDSFCLVYRRELERFSDYYVTWIASGESKLKTGKWSVSKIGKRLIWLIEEIGPIKTEEEDGCIIITKESIQRDNERQEYLVKQNLVYYRLLHQHLLESSTHFATYLLSGVLTEKQIESLKDFTSDIHDVLLLHPDDYENAEIILEFKKLIFEKTDDILPLLSVSEETQIDVRYRDVVS